MKHGGEHVFSPGRTDELLKGHKLSMQIVLSLACGHYIDLMVNSVIDLATVRIAELKTSGLDREAMVTSVC